MRWFGHLRLNRRNKLLSSHKYAAKSREIIHIYELVNRFSIQHPETTVRHLPCSSRTATHFISHHQSDRSVGRLVGQVPWNRMNYTGQDSAAAVLFCENDKWHKINVAIISTLFGKSFSFFAFVSLAGRKFASFNQPRETASKKVRTLLFRFNCVFHVQHLHFAFLYCCVPIFFHRLHTSHSCVLYTNAELHKWIDGLFIACN